MLEVLNIVQALQKLTANLGSRVEQDGLPQTGCHLQSFQVRGQYRRRSSSLGETISAPPRAIASRDMPKTTQVSAASAMVMPPIRRILTIPSAPSSPIPVSKTPTACGP